MTARAGAPAVAFSLTARLSERSEADAVRLFERGRATDPGVVSKTAAIIDRVREHGDAALHEFATHYDGVRLTSLEVPASEWQSALETLEPATVDALRFAADAIARVHRAQRPERVTVETWPGVRVTRVFEPLSAVGVYAPGGRAAYPSSVLMGVIPARVAGVEDVVVCSPPGPDGRPPASVLAACAIAGADRVFAIGGAGAIAALAYGTDSIPRVDRVVGPGNAWVTEAKRQLHGVVGIDCPAGPSEVLIVADSDARVEVIAAEMIAQAEHDPDAVAVLVTTDSAHLESVPRLIALQLDGNARSAIVEAALASNGALVAVDDMTAALRFATRFAPEHLLLLVQDAAAAAGAVKGAGSIFLGEASSVTFGDYATGANHVLPTGGRARFYSGLSTLDFGRWVTVQEVGDEGAAALAPVVATLADAEGFPGHAAAARMRSRAEAASNDAMRRLHDRASSHTMTDAARYARRPSLRPEYAQLRMYDPGRTPCEIDLSDNTNLFGVPPTAQDALTKLAQPTVTRYPSVYANALKQRFAALLAVDPDQLTTGCGSDDVIDSALRAFAGPGAHLVHPDPTFGIVPTFARMNALSALAVPLQPDFELDVDAILATHSALIYLCRPNNPTGTLFRRADVERILQRAEGVVMIDEAYVDFGGDDVVRLAIESERAVVLRTMSKAYGLAGLRIGFAAGSTRLIAEIEKSRGPYKVSAAAEAAALAVLERDRDWVEEQVANVITNRGRLTRELHAAGHTVVPSSANFVLIRLRDSAGAIDTANALRAREIAVRPFPSLTGLGECIRVTVAPWPQLERFLDAFRAVTRVAP